MNAADMLAAMDSLHPLERDRVAAKLLAFAAIDDLIAEMNFRYFETDEGTDVAVFCDKIVAYEAAVDLMAASQNERLRLVPASQEPTP